MTTRKSLAWSFSQQFGQYVLQFTSSIIIARLLTPDEVGIFALAIAAHSLISSLRDFGVGSYLVREEELNRDKIRTAFGMWLVISWGLALVVLLTRNFIADLYDAPGIADVMILLSVSFFITPFGQPAQALLLRDMRFDVLHHITLVSAALSAATSVTLAFLGFSYMSLAWGMVTGIVVRLVMLLAIRRDHLKLMPGFRYWREVTNFGGYMTGASLVGTVNGEGVKFVLGGILAPASVALFERAGQLPSMARQALLTPVGRVIFPAFARDIRNGHTIGPSVVKVVEATTVIIWPAFLTIGLLSVPIVVFLFSDTWRVAGEILPYLLIANAIQTILPQPDHILVPHGKARRLFIVRSITMTSSLLLGVAGAMQSLELFAMLRPVQAVLSMTLFYFAIRPYWQTHLSDLITGYWKALLIAVLSAIPALAVVLTFGWTVPFWALMSVGISAPLIWLGLIFLLRHPLAAECTAPLRMLRARLSRSGAA